MTPRPPRGAKKRVLLTAERLRDLYQAETELKYENPFQLLIATVLSAQTTDRSVNLVTPELFRRLILHGRRVCLARRPRCEECVLNDFCPSSLARPGRRLGKGRPIGEAPGSDVKLAWHQPATERLF